MPKSLNMTGLACIRFFNACISALALSTAARMLALSAASRDALCCSSVSSRFRAPRVADEEGESLPSVSGLLPAESGGTEYSVQGAHSHSGVPLTYDFQPIFLTFLSRILLTYHFQLSIIQSKIVLSKEDAEYLVCLNGIKEAEVRNDIRWGQLVSKMCLCHLR